MATSRCCRSRRVFIGHWHCARLVPGLLMVVALAGGCVTGTYRPNALPERYHAPVTARMDQADLSRLTTYAMRSDQVDAGDVLEVTIFSSDPTAEAKPMKLRVAGDGSLNVPMIGPVPVKGLTLDESERAIGIAAVQRDIYRAPHVTVIMDAQRVNRVTILGAVEEEGVVELPRGNSNLLAAFVAAGGLSDEAGWEVEIRRPALSNSVPDVFRGQPMQFAGDSDGVMLASYEEGLGDQARTVMVNLEEASREGKGGFYLDDGDVVHVKKKPERVFRVMGLVTTPGEYEFPKDRDIYMLDALSTAGGRRMQAADSVLVIRRVEGEVEPVKIRISVRAAQETGVNNIRLQEDDLVIVEETPVTMAFETLKTFFRFSVGSSMALF